MARGGTRGRLTLACMTALLLAGCAEEMDDLRQFVQETKQRPGGKIKPLPEFEPYEGFTYNSADLRDPFRPRTEFTTADEGEEGSESGLAPDRDRRREPLEQYPLDSLHMVGTLSLGEQRRGLVRDPEGTIHRVVPGNYMGQNHGRIAAVSAGAIRVTEIVRDGQGGWMERDAGLALKDEE